MDICAGIVLFNPLIDKLKVNVFSIVSQVKEVLLIDNGSMNIAEIECFLQCCKGMRIKLIKNGVNLGIGKALNQILDYSMSNGYDWFITLDQDSISKSGLLDKYISFVTEGEKKIGQLTCNIQDENLGELDKELYDECGYVEVESCITSGVLNNTKAIQAVGRFNENFFIDGVDIEISLRLRNAGYSVIKINYDGLKHSLGNGKKIRILGNTFLLTHHVPWRNYYMRRNFIYIARKYYFGWKMVKAIIRQVLFSIGSIVFEDQKIARIKYCVKGIIDGFRI